MIYHSPINTLPISLLLSKALLIAKMISESAFNIKSAFDSKSAFRYHFWMKKCKVGAFGYGTKAKLRDFVQAFQIKVHLPQIVQQKKCQSVHCQVGGGSCPQNHASDLMTKLSLH